MSIMLFENPDCVFIRIRKTGSTSIVRGMFGQRENAKIVTHRGEWVKEFEGKFVFAFVRNPYERLISCLRMFRSYEASSQLEIETRANLNVTNLLNIVEDESIDISGLGYISKLRLHSIPATNKFFNVKKANFIGRFEQFEKDYCAVAYQLGIQVKYIPHERHGPTWNYRDAYTTSERARAYKIFRDDIESFEYRF